MEDLYRLFPSADTQVGEGGESERERRKWKTREWERQTGKREEHQMLSSIWSGRIPVWIQAPWLMRIINMACPASPNAGEDWRMGDKNKTSQAHPHKIHKAAACKKDIAHAGWGRCFLMQHHTPMDPGNGDTYPTRTLAWTLNPLDCVWSTVAKEAI